MRKVLKGTVCAPHCAWGGVVCADGPGPLGSSWGLSAGTVLGGLCELPLSPPGFLGGVRGLQPPPHTEVGLWGMQQSLCLLAL